MLPEYRVVDARIEYLGEDEVRAMQSERLVAQVRHCYETTLFWRRKFDAAGVRPGDIRGVDDLAKVPFCTKADLQADQKSYPPFGSYVGVDNSRLGKFFSTSGTTGTPVIRVMSRRDWSYVVQRLQRTSLLVPGDRAVLLGPTDGLVGPTAGLEGMEAAGALVVRAARATTQERIKLIRDLKPRLVTATASFLLYLADTAASQGMAFPNMGGVPILLSVGEPGAAIPATRERLKTAFGASIVIDGFGLTELFPLGDSCPGCPDSHLANDFVIAEVIDPETGEVLPRGRQGELVYTNIIGDSQPLLRYRSRDIGTLAPFGPCPGCGATPTRIVNGIQGRVDNMIWYKGINIFPSAIEAVVRSFEELSNEFEIVLDQVGAIQTMTVRVEVTRGREAEGIRERLAERLVRALEGVHVGLELLDEGTLPKTQYKGQRVRDMRKQHV